MPDRRSDAFTAVELILISTVMGNHATHLLARPGLNREDRMYALELQHIANKAQLLSQPRQTNGNGDNL